MPVKQEELGCGELVDGVMQGIAAVGQSRLVGLGHGCLGAKALLYEIVLFGLGL